MPIFEDISKIGAEQEGVSMQFGPDFFTQSLNIPNEDEGKPEGAEEVSTQFSNWKQEINRLFMKGMTAKAIFDSIGEKIDEAPNSKEIKDYIQKYEGLIGTIFIDSGVLESGFPRNLIPREWAQYNRFAINCKHPVMKTETKIDGGLSGDIEAFLSAVDHNVRQEKEVCSITGLPVLRAGMFTPEVITSIFDSIGQTGTTLADLQKVMKILALHMTDDKSAERPEFQEPDVRYGLGEQKMEVETQHPQETEKNVLKYNLKPSALSAKIQHAHETYVKGYAPSKKADINGIIKIEIMEDPESLNLEDGEILVRPQMENQTVKDMKIDYDPSEKQDISFENPVCDIFNGEPDGANLEENGLVAEAAPEEEHMTGPVFLTYDESKKPDIQLVEIPGHLNRVKMDDNLRF